MKILSIVTNRYANFYQDQCLALGRKGNDITHVYPQKQSESYTERQNISRSVLDYTQIYTDVLKESIRDYDIIHANNGKTAPFALAQPNRPVILTLWGSDLMDVHPKLSQLGAKYATKVILPSSAMSPYLSVDHTVIPFGIDVSLFRPIPQKKAREILGWDQNKKIVLFPYPPSRTVKQFGLAERVVDQLDRNVELRTLPGIPHEKVPVYMNASDVVLVTSKRESGPMVIKEAALCNVPVVSTNVGFASQALSDIKNSYVCNSECDLVEQLDTVLDPGIQSDGRKHADDWSLETMSEELINLYESALNDNV